MRDVEFGLPHASWARPVFAQVENRLRGEGFDPHVENGTSAEVPRFLRVRVEGPSEVVAETVASILRIVSTTLEWGPDTEYVLAYKGARRRVPNMRLKLASAHRFRGSGVFVPWRTRLTTDNLALAGESPAAYARAVRRLKRSIAPRDGLAVTGDQYS